MVDRLVALKKDYLDRHTYWGQAQLGSPLAELLLQKAHQPAEAFYRLALDELAPAVRKAAEQGCKWRGLAIRMQPHPATVEYLRQACQRPGMYMRDHDIQQLEMQLHGFDAALAATGALGSFAAFNRPFADFVQSTIGLSGSQGWAVALIKHFGAGAPAFNAFSDLLCKAFPADFHGDRMERP